MGDFENALGITLDRRRQHDVAADFAADLVDVAGEAACPAGSRLLGLDLGKLAGFRFMPVWQAVLISF